MLTPPPIFIDTQQITEEFSLSKKEVDQLMDFVVKSITRAFAWEWEQQAKKHLAKTRRRYIQSLSVVEEGRLEGAVVLNWADDPVVGFVENGIGAFDMKEGFSKSPKRKQKKDGGWVLTIPFRIATPDALGESDLFAFRMDDEVYDIVKQLPQDVEVSGGGLRTEGLKLAQIPERFRAPKARPALSNLQTAELFPEYKHKSSIYEGLSRVQDNVTGQNVYMNFRRVSDNSDPNAFIHSGIVAHNLAQKSLDAFSADMPVEINRALNSGLKKLGV